MPPPQYQFSATQITREETTQLARDIHQLYEDPAIQHLQLTEDVHRPNVSNVRFEAIAGMTEQTYGILTRRRAVAVPFERGVLGGLPAFARTPVELQVSHIRPVGSTVSVSSTAIVDPGQLFDSLNQPIPPTRQLTSIPLRGFSELQQAAQTQDVLIMGEFPRQPLREDRPGHTYTSLDGRPILRTGDDDPARQITGEEEQRILETLYPTRSPRNPAAEQIAELEDKRVFEILEEAAEYETRPSRFKRIDQD